MKPEYFFYGGLALCAVAVIAAIIATVVMYIAKKRLDKKLDYEYGRRRH